MKLVDEATVMIALRFEDGSVKKIYKTKKLERKYALSNLLDSLCRKARSEIGGGDAYES